MSTILCVDDEPNVGLIVEDTLSRVGHRVEMARGVADALAVLARGGVDLIISDYAMPGLTGLDFLELLAKDGYQVPLIMLTGYASVEHAAQAIKAGAVDFITKPVRPQQLELAVEHALELARLKRENAALRAQVTEIRTEREIVGGSAVMRALLRAVAAAAPTRAAVLLRGEPGTGKELVARALHDLSDRRDKPFVKLNCAALPEGLADGALFGHERGALAGAVKRVLGAFERAQGGTLLLDDVSELSLDLQAKLMRVLQEQPLQHGAAAVPVDVRLVATTNRDLAAAARAGHFREELRERLSAVALDLPPLRQRVDDIPMLVQRFAARAAAEARRELRGIAPQAMELLQRHAWPGNVRELQHAVERAVILSSEPVLQARDFETTGFGPAGAAPPCPHADGQPADGAVVLHTLDITEAERVLIERALARTGQNRTRAAELLGINVRTLRNKLNRKD